MGRVGFNLNAEDGTASVRIAGQQATVDSEGLQEVRAGLGRTGISIDKKGIKEVSIDLAPSIPSVPLLDESPGPSAKIERLDGDRGYQTTVEAGGGQARVSLGIGGDGLVLETQSGPSETEGVVDGAGKIRLSSRTQLIPGGESEASTEVIVDGCSISVRNTFFEQNFGFDLTLPSCEKPQESVTPPPSTGQGTPDDQSWDAKGDLPDFRAGCRYKIWFLIERNEHLYADCTGYNVYGGCTGYGFASFQFNSLPGKLYLKAPTKVWWPDFGEYLYYMNVGGILGLLYVCGPRSGGLACTEGADFSQSAPGGFPGVIGNGQDAHIQVPEGYGVTFFDNVLGADASALIAERTAYYESWGQYTNIRVFVVEYSCTPPLVKRDELIPDYTSGPSGPPAPWSYPPTKPMDKSCCSMLRKIMEFFRINDITTSGFPIPERLQMTGGEGEQICKDWAEIHAATIRIIDHLGVHPFSVAVTDLRSDIEGNQGFEMDLPSATQAMQIQMAKLWSEGGKADTMQRFIFQLSLLTTHIAIMNAKQIAGIEAIKDALGADFEFTQDPFRLPFNLKAGQVTTDTTRGKGFDPKKKKDIVESNGIEYDPERLDPSVLFSEFLQPGDTTIAYEKFAGNKDVMDLLKLIIIKLEKLQNR